MTRLARGLKCGWPRTRPADALDPMALGKPGFNNEPRAPGPIPVPRRPKKWRRVMNSRCSVIGSILISSVLRDSLVEVQNRAGHGGPGGQLHGVRIGWFAFTARVEFGIVGCFAGKRR